jgi:hypothetical protein
MVQHTPGGVRAIHTRQHLLSAQIGCLANPEKGGREALERFGAEYRRYMERVSMFFPKPRFLPRLVWAHR